MAFGADTLFPFSEKSGHATRASASMQYGDHQQRAFLRRIRDQVGPHRQKAQRASGEVRPTVSLPAKNRQPVDSIEDIPDHPIGGVNVVLSNEFLDVS